MSTSLRNKHKVSTYARNKQLKVSTFFRTTQTFVRCPDVFYSVGQWDTGQQGFRLSIKDFGIKAKSLFYNALAICILRFPLSPLLSQSVPEYE